MASPPLALTRRRSVRHRPRNRHRRLADARQQPAVPPFYLLADPALLAARARTARRSMCQSGEASAGRGATRVFGDALPVVPLPQPLRRHAGQARPGQRRRHHRGHRPRCRRLPCRARRGASSPARSPRSRSTRPASAFPATPNISRIWRREATGDDVTPVMMLAGPELAHRAGDHPHPARRRAGGADRRS